MDTDDSKRQTGVRYQPDEKPPVALAFGLGLQLALLCVTVPVLIPAVVIRAAGGTEAILSWTVFAAVVVCGTSTALQAIRVGRIGAGYVLAMGSSGAFIAVCVKAVAEGGPAMLATLVVIASFFQIALSARLSLFRQILTPTVSGTVIMLIPVTVMPIIFGLLKDVPEGATALAAPLSALATLLLIVAIALKATGALRLWALVIGVAAGSGVSGFFGLYDVGRVAEAAWIGLPEGEWPGLDLGFGPVFWTLLPAFVLVMLVSTIQVIGGSVAIQRVSWRRPRAVDFRAVQGAVAAGSVGNLLAGLAGTVPNTAYSASVSVTELTGVAARRVGAALGVIFIVLAFSPKALAVILAIPGPVAAAYVTVLLAMLFVTGMKIVVQDGIDYRKCLVAGVAFWSGVGFQNGLIFPGQVSEFAGGLLQNGMTAGGLAAILMTLFMKLTESRHRRIEVEFDISALPKISEFLGDFASRNGWDAAMTNRLDAASEETFLTLLRQDEGEEMRGRRRLLLSAHEENGGAVLEFIAAPGDDNLQDRIALLGELGERSGEAPGEREVSLRLLRHFASSVRHQQYHDTDVVTVRVDAQA